MALVKVLKNKAYFRKFQVKPRRRREGKTDYKARRKMIRQDKNKYNAKKYRLVVRFTGKRCVVQVVYSTIVGDMMVSQATSDELTKYGVPVGHKNYAAAYCTGLLCARRTLKKLGIDEMFVGKEEVDGEDYHIEDEESERRPFKAILDVGLQSTTNGHRMWGALKGAVDGGMHVPHNNKKFPGYKAPDEKGQEAEYDADAHKHVIFGGHVSEYMEMMEEEDPTKYEAHFAKYIEADVSADKLEDMYTEAHAKIREDPTFVPKEKKDITHTRDGQTIKASSGQEWERNVKIGLEARKAKVLAKIQKAQEKALMED